MHYSTILTQPPPPPLFAAVTGNVRNESLLQLASCTPQRARIPYPECDRIMTPYQVAVWEQSLASFVEYISREGFRIGFDYKQVQDNSGSGNMKSAKDHEEVVDKYIGTECEKRRLLGPCNVASIHKYGSAHLVSYQSQSQGSGG